MQERLVVQHATHSRCTLYNGPSFNALHPLYSHRSGIITCVGSEHHGEMWQGIRLGASSIVIRVQSAEESGHSDDQFKRSEPMFGHSLALDAMLRHWKWYDEPLDSVRHNADICASSYLCSPSPDKLGLPRPPRQRSLRLYAVRLQYSTLLYHGSLRDMSRCRNRAVSLGFALSDYSLIIGI